MEEKTLGIHSIKHGNKNHTLAPAANVSNSYRVIILLTHTNPNKAPVTGNPSKLPYLCIVYFPLKWVTLNHPGKFRRKNPHVFCPKKNLTWRRHFNADFRKKHPIKAPGPLVNVVWRRQRFFKKYHIHRFPSKLLGLTHPIIPRICSSLMRKENVPSHHSPKMVVAHGDDLPWCNP